MADVPVQTASSELQFSEFNNLTEGLRNYINSTSQTASSGDTNQYAKSAAEYAASGWFYTDSGAADAYVLTNIGTLKSPNAYVVGELISFRAANANTGASTVNVATKGVKNIKKADGATDPAAGDIPTDRDTWARYDGTSFRIQEFGSGTGSDTNTVSLTEVGHGYAGEEWIRINGVDLTVEAQADSAINSEVFGVVESVADVNNITVRVSGYTDQLSGLTGNTLYFLDPTTPGAITATEPTTNGQISKPVFLALNATSGIVLQYRGTVISGAAASDTAMIKLATSTASNDATIDFEGIDATYAQYEVQYSNVTPVTNGVDFHFRVGTGMTPTYQSGASDYGWTLARLNPSSVSANGSGAAAQVSLTVGGGLGNVSNEQLSGFVRIFSPASTSSNTNISTHNIQKNDSATMTSTVGGGQYLSNTAVSAFRFSTSSGNISSGTFTLYGIK